MGQNAMTGEDKQRRRRDLLDAALTLFRERRDLPPVSTIASAAGLAKGTVYLYFASKEEIFIALLEDEFSRLFEGLGAIIADLPASPAKAARRFAESYSDHILAQDSLLPLAALANGVLEQNLPVEALRRFKTMLADGIVVAGARLEGLFGNLEPGRGATLLLQTYALTLGLWQALDYPEALRPLLDEPALKPLKRSFAGEMECAVRTLWMGCLTAHAE